MTAFHFGSQKSLVYLLTSSRPEGRGFLDGGFVTCKEKPTPEDMRRKNLANEAIEKDLRVETIVLPRDDAEKKFGRIIYDLFPVPEHVRELTIVIIRDLDGSLWNINACNKEHTRTTGEIGKIVIRKYRFRRSKELLEVSFDVE